MSISGRPKILIVDDESGIRDLLVEILSDEGYTALTAENAEAAWAIRAREQLALILLDIWMPGKDGLTLLKQWVDCGLVGVPIVIMSGHATINTAVEAIKLGAREVLEKPIATSRLLMALENVLRDNKGEEKGNPQIRAANFGQSSAMREFKQNLLTASANTHPVLITGAPDSGATFYAQMLAPPRRPSLFIHGNAELEGGTEDILRRATGGAVIVPLIDRLSAVQQNGLLALLRESARAGVRVVACTMTTPEELKTKHHYNPAVLAALSSHVIRQPPLAECAEDIPVIADLIVQQLSETAVLPHKRLSSSAVRLLAARVYINDFIELLTLVRGAMMHAHGDVIDAQTVSMVTEQFDRTRASETVSNDIFSLPLRDARVAFENEYFQRLMNASRGNIQLAMKISGLERTYLYRKIKQYK